MHILGIHSSPFPDGNTATLLHLVLQEAAQTPGVSTEAVSLAGLTIADCRQCDWCREHQTLEQPCVVADDALPILRRMRACDILVLATPVYFARMSGAMACLIDRTRCFLSGKAGRMALRDKVGVALAVGWFRNYGLEPALLSLHNAFLIHGMRPAASYAAGALYGAAVVSGQREGDQRGVLADEAGVRAAKRLMTEGMRIAGQRPDDAAKLASG